MYILKSRGMAHSNQMREFVLSDKGIRLVDVYLGSGQVLTGAARMAQEVKDRAQALANQQEEESRQRELLQEQANLQTQAGAIAQRLKSIGSELQLSMEHDKNRQQAITKERQNLSQARS